MNSVTTPPFPSLYYQVVRGAKWIVNHGFPLTHQMVDMTLIEFVDSKNIFATVCEEELRALCTDETD